MSGRGSLEVLELSVSANSLLPVIWEVVGVDGSGDHSTVYLRGRVIGVLILDTEHPDHIDAAIEGSRIFGGVYFIQPGAKLVSCPPDSDWIRQKLPEAGLGVSVVSDLTQVQVDPATGLMVPTRVRVDRSAPTEDVRWPWSYVSDLDNHARFFLLTTDHYTKRVEDAILAGRRGREGRVQILIGRPASDAERRQVMSASTFKPPAPRKRYHPYYDEFVHSVMAEWVQALPPILFLPPLGNDESYTLLGFVALSVPPDQITIRRDHDMETQPVLRSVTLHKAPRANTTHEWTMRFVVDGEDINRVLVPLLRQIDRCPFLPILNSVFAKMGITEVVVDGVEVSTLPEHPNALQVQLVGRKFDTGGLSFTMPFAAGFNWPLFKVYTDYLPRFLPVDIPMNGKVKILVPTDEYIAEITQRVFDANRVAEKLGFSPGGFTGADIEVPIEVFTQPDIGHFALLPSPSDQSRVFRYEVLRVGHVAHFKHLATVAMNGSLEGFEVRTLYRSPQGKVFISSSALTPAEIKEVIQRVQRGKPGVVRDVLESFVFCWRMDSMERVDLRTMDSTLVRLVNATFKGRRTGSSYSSSGPLSIGRPITPQSPEMEPFLPDGLNVQWESISAGFSNTVSVLRRDVGDPIMQYIGKTDTTIVLQAVTDGEGLLVLRSLFDRYIAIAYMLRGLSFLYPVRFNFRIENEIAQLMGLEDVVPVSMDVQNIEGAVDAYRVTLTFVGMDPGGVQRRAMYRLSSNVERSGRLFTLSQSGVTESAASDRLLDSLRRSELYPDLRLPQYGLLLEWCRAMAYRAGTMWEYVERSLRDLFPGSNEQEFRTYIGEVSRLMEDFLIRIQSTGLLARMSQIPHVFADPDFFFHAGDYDGEAMRRLVMQSLKRVGEQDILFTDDHGVTGSFRLLGNIMTASIHQNDLMLRSFLAKSADRTRVHHPYARTVISASAELSEQMYRDTTESVLGRAAASQDTIASVFNEQRESYQQLSNRFRRAFSIPEREVITSYSHRIGDSSVISAVQNHERQAVDNLRFAYRGVHSKHSTWLFGVTAGEGGTEATTALAPPVHFSQSKPEKVVVAGVSGNVKDAVTALVAQSYQALRGNTTTYTLVNSHTMPESPATFRITWKPAQMGLTAQFLRSVGAIRLYTFAMGMIQQESSFSPTASSGVAHGIGQFTPDTWRGLMSSGRYTVEIVQSGAGSSPSVDYMRWDLASIMSLLYLVELTVGAVYSVVGKQQSTRRDFADFVCAEEPGLRSRVIADPVAVLTAPAESSVYERLLVLGACLYNAGPGALTTILAQLAHNVRAGVPVPDQFSIARTNKEHGAKVYRKYRVWYESTNRALPDQSVAQSTDRSRGEDSLLDRALRVFKLLNIPLLLREVYRVYSGGAHPPTRSIVASGANRHDTDHAAPVLDYPPMPNIVVRGAGLPTSDVPTPQSVETALPDPFEKPHTLSNFPLLPLTGWSTMVRYQPHGRLLQCFPTYCLILVQGGRWVRWHRFWDHFYGLFSVMSIDVHKSRENPQHTAEIILSNSYRQLSNMAVTQAYAQAAIAGMRPFQQVQGEELMYGASDANAFVRQMVKSIQNSLFPILGDYERHVWNQEMKALFLHPGERIHLRMGYGADADSLPVVFNGTISGVDIQGGVIRMVAIGDGRELMREIATEGQPYKNSNWLGQTVEIRNIVIDMLASRRADTIPVIGPIVYTFTGAGFLNDSRFGIESFGRVEALAGSVAAAEAVSGVWSPYLYKALGALSMQASEGEVGVNIYNSQRDSSNVSIGMLPMLDTLTLGLSQLARNGDFIAIELKQGTVWDVFRNCQLAMLDALLSVEPFGTRSTLFLGRGYQALHYAYYSGDQLEALGVRDIASRISMGGYWRIMKFRQYRQYHVALSDWNLIANELSANAERMWNEAQAFDAEGVPGNKFVFDPAIVPEERKPIFFHSAISTTLMSQLSLGAESNWLSALARIQGIRQLIGQRLGIAMPLRAVNNVAANLVREGVSLMYDGSIVMIGSAEIKPHDWIVIDDRLRAMEGVIAVREVEHHFSTQHGYTTLVVPDACVLGNSDLDTTHIIHAAELGLRYAAYRGMRSQMITIYRGYLVSLLYMVSLALARARFITSRVPGLRHMADNVMVLLGAAQRIIRPSVSDLLHVVLTAASSAGSHGWHFLKLLFHGAYSKDSLRNLLQALLVDVRSIVSTLKVRDVRAALSIVMQMLNRLGGLGAARPLLQLRTLLGAAISTICRTATAKFVIAGGVLEMINRHLSSYYPCRLYPVRVNGLPLTAGIRGHFGTVDGDHPAPMQRLLDVITLNDEIFRFDPSMPKVMEYAFQIAKAVWPLRRDVPTRVINNGAPQSVEEVIEQYRQFEQRSRYDLMGVYGSIDEIYNGVSPTLQTGRDAVIQYNQPYRRSTVGYAPGDDPAKGDYLLDAMHPQAAPVLRELLQELRRRGVQVAIHQGRRSLEEQISLYEQLQTGKRSKAAAKPTPNAPHVAGRAIDVQYRQPDGTYRGTPPSHQEHIILAVVEQINSKYAASGMRVRWLGDRRRYSGALYEPWHFDVSLPGG